MLDKEASQTDRPTLPTFSAFLRLRVNSDFSQSASVRPSVRSRIGGAFCLNYEWVNFPFCDAAELDVTAAAAAAAVCCCSVLLSSSQPLLAVSSSGAARRRSFVNSSSGSMITGWTTDGLRQWMRERRRQLPLSRSGG